MENLKNMKNQTFFLTFICALLLANHGAMAAGLRVETFNLGAARGFVDHARERFPLALQKLAPAEADILCLQEVWHPDDRAELARALGKKYPHIFKTAVVQTPTARRPSCKPWEIFGEGKFVSCMNNQCGDVSGDAFTDCIIEKCGQSLDRLKRDNRECASALMAKVGKNPILAILQLINPFYRSGLFAYDGSDGLILLSKLPLRDKKLVDLSDISTLNRRRALSAEISYKDKPVRILCGHLSSKLNVPYTGTFEGWEEENMAQTNRLIEETENDERAILMGDFNCGLASEDGSVQAELPEACRLLGGSFSDPLSEINACTYCSSNALIPHDNGDLAIDHIFLKGLSANKAAITRKEKVFIKSGKETIETNLSDHYGFEVTID